MSIATRWLVSPDDRNRFCRAITSVGAVARQHSMRLARRALPLLLSTLPTLAQAQTAPAVRNWDASARLFAIQDSNAPLAGNGSGFAGSTKGPTYGLAFNGSKDLHVANRGWRVALVGSASQTYQSEPALRNFDVASLSGGLSASRNLPLGSVPSRLTLGYQFSQSWLGGSRFQNGHNANGDLTASIGSRFKLGVSAGVSSSDFRDDGTQPASTSRDSRGHNLGVHADLGFNNNRQALSASLTRQRVNASGSNFDVDGNTAALGFRSFIVFPWVVAVNASHSTSDYVSYIGIPQRAAKSDNLSVTLAGPIARDWSADLTWNASRYGSNLDAYRTSRQQVMVGLGYKF